MINHEADDGKGANDGTQTKNDMLAVTQASGNQATVWLLYELSGQSIGQLLNVRFPLPRDRMPDGFKGGMKE